jgi:hypothetical protein
MPDTDGTDLPNADVARKQAVTFAGEFLRDHGEGFWKEADWRVWVTDETGDTICALRFLAEPA